MVSSRLRLIWAMCCFLCLARSWAFRPLVGRSLAIHTHCRPTLYAPAPCRLNLHAQATTVFKTNDIAANKSPNWTPLRAVRLYGKRVASFFETQLPMLQYLWPSDNPRLRLYLVLSMVFMFTGKWFNTRVPFMLQRAIDNIPGSVTSGTLSRSTGTAVALSVLLYGLSRALAVFCEELKTCLFTNVSQSVLRRFAHQIFTHLHSLGSDFHLQTPSGVISVAYVRAVRGFQALMFQLVFSVAPTMLELAMVARILQKKFSPVFAAITLTTFTSYLLFTMYITQWRVRVRREIVEVDNARNGFFIDSLLNQEVVKLFNNEPREIKRFDSYLDRMQKLNIESTYAVAALNVGQAVLFCAGLTASLLVALGRVQGGRMSVGDLVAVNAMLLQLAVPFDFIGYTYQELRQSLVDMKYMTEVLNNFAPAVPDPPHALPLETHLHLQLHQHHQDQHQGQHQDGTEERWGWAEGAERAVEEDQTSNGILEPPAVAARRYQYFPSTATSPATTAFDTSLPIMDDTRVLPPSSLEFRDVVFSYKRPSQSGENKIVQDSDDNGDLASGGDNVLLDGISFQVRAGENVAIVGPSGSGKSTVLKLITRMLDADSGEILLDGANIAHVTKDSIRRRVAVVPQDTCLFDETVGYNIRYGTPHATDEEVQEVVRLSNLKDTIARLPQGMDTVVGERGGRLSGGERQKVSLARALLRKPSLLLCDEVTSSVDALAEREIIQALRGSSISGTSSGSGQRGTAESTLLGDYSVESGQILVPGHWTTVESDAPAMEVMQVPRTTITVAHRLSSIAHCDRILVLQRGRLVEQGTHRELLAMPGGVYRNMWQVQNSIDDGAKDSSMLEEGTDYGWPQDERCGNISHPARLHSFL